MPFTGAVKTFVSPAVRAVFIFWILTCVIYNVTYASNLVALLSVEIEKQPFSSLQELAVHNNFKIGILGGSAFVTQFRVRILLFYFC